MSADHTRLRRSVRPWTELISDGDLPELSKRLSALEQFCAGHIESGFASEKSEVIARRVLWALRGSNDDPPHPDRASPARPMQPEEER